MIVDIPRVDKLLWFGPESFAAQRAIHIRLEPAKNGQSKGFFFATDDIG